ncbi:HesA/MoeB/ThiF family protein [Lutimonas halocynthiae]|uniref:HesA/MoeB/ThiF family protein n=1 Tax=Lutimonas halocynthiae TaxID=1446477 RepID=UPI0025B2E958|nr:HesA/MoeB/ThiF family protein [Lutimonas halocynthiae]MDN3641272.1 HesA/MoeB/ThiF family protein [Lutimonas halocynthiae]
MDKEKMFIRQTTLPEVGLKGQEKLSNAKIAIIGCGGLGSAAAVYLAATGIGQIHLIDYDKIDVSNLHRQVFYKLEEVGKSKAKSLAKHIESISSFVSVSIHEEPINKYNITEELKNYSIILDCTDSLPTKYLLNDYCVLNNKTLVYGSLYKHDGYVAVFNADSKDGRTAHLRDAFPEMSKKHVPNCSEIGTLNPIVGIIGLMQANEVIKIITETGTLLINKILIYNSMDNSQFIMKLKSAFSKDRVAAIYNNENYFDARCELQDEGLLIEANQLRNKLPDGNIKIISVIADTNFPIPFSVDLSMPNSKFDAAKLAPFMSNEIVVVCQKGISSYATTKRIRKEFSGLKVFSLKNGLENY